MYVAVTIDFEQNGEPMCLLLDIVQVSKSHTGFNLARAFADILEEFGISNTVSYTPEKLIGTYCSPDPQYHM
jgi:hypothetical protein